MSMDVIIINWYLERLTYNRKYKTLIIPSSIRVIIRYNAYSKYLSNLLLKNKLKKLLVINDSFLKYYCLI